MAAPITGILDNFNRTNEGPPPSANWITDPLAFGDDGLKVISNEAAGNSSSFNDGYWNAIFGPDSEAYTTIITLPGSAAVDTAYLMLRLASVETINVDGYYFEYANTATTDAVKIFRVDDQAFTQLGATMSQNFVDGDGLWAEAIGSNLSVYRYNSGTWSLIGTRIDATYGGAGYIGLGCENTTARFDNFGGGGAFTHTASSSITPTTTSIKNVGRSLVSSTTPATSNIKQISTAKTSSIGISSALSKTFTKLLSSILGSTSTIIRSVNRAFSGSINLSTQLIRSASTNLASALDISSILNRVIYKVETSSLLSSSEINKSTTTGLSSSIQLSTQIFRAVFILLTSNLTFDSTLSAIKTVVLNLASSLGLTSTISRSTNKNLISSIVITSSIVKLISKLLSSIITPTSSLLASLVVQNVKGVANVFDVSLYNALLLDLQINKADLTDQSLGTANLTDKDI